MVLGEMLRAIWRYRSFVLGSVAREFHSRYRNSLLGAVWAVLNPLAMIVIYTVIFSQLMQARLPGIESTFAYSVYLCAGMLTWGLFAEIVTRGQSVFIENANLLKKLNFPRICLPIIVALTALINFSIIFGLFNGFLLFTGNFPGLVFFGVVPVLLIQIAFSVGLGILLGVLNVFFRDVGQMVGVLLQFWFWFTPVIYPISIVPEWTKALLQWNPMTALVTTYQNIFLSRAWPDWPSLGPVSVLALLLCGLALSSFREHAGEMVDEL
jgi:lipopolysaccharide transport system permease protein